jgi:hypothetical protein
MELASSAAQQQLAPARLAAPVASAADLPVLGSRPTGH